MMSPPISITVITPAKLTDALMPHAAMAPIATTTPVTSTGSGRARNTPTYPTAPRLMAAAATMAMPTTSRPMAVASLSERKASRT